MAHKASSPEIHEAAFVRAFVIPEKQGRLLELLPNPKRRKTILRTLPHFRDLDPRFARQIPSSMQSPDAIEALLMKRRAPAECYVISENSDLDARTMQLSPALAEIVGIQGGTVVCCIPGVLAYFEGEEQHDRWLLERKNGSS